MLRRTVVGVGVMALVCLAAVSDAVAQQASGIAGLVRDTSGAVLPGVTVEAASPALIEKVRTVITDGEGQYKIIDLRPGIYTVTFGLPGFSSVRREGIELTAGFTATINADMRVGAVEEPVTVSGSSPLADVQNVKQQKVISDELLDALPSGSKSMAMLFNLTPGFSAMADVGGSRGVYQSSFINASFRGKTNLNKTTFDGMRTNVLEGTSQSGYFPASAAVEEITLETGGGSAESSAAGAVVNFIPKEGGNSFTGSVWGLFGDDGLQSNNLNDTLRARGITTVPKVLDIWDHGASLGGPIKQDRLWFHTTHRWLGVNNQMAGVYFNKTQGTPFYTPDLDRPGTRDEHFRSNSARLTWQATPKNKFSGWVDIQKNRTVFFAPSTAPEALNLFDFSPVRLFQVTWSSPVTNKLLFDAGVSVSEFNWPVRRQPGVAPDHVSILNVQNGFRYNAVPFLYGDPKISDRYAQRFSGAYVTGSHAFKAGLYIDEAVRDRGIEVNGDVSYQFLGTTPIAVQQYATPYRQKEIQKADLGVFVQDQWTIRRLTLNLGVRLDYLNMYVPEQHVPAGPWVPARDFAPVDQVPAWTDLNPRLGAAYDLFGNGRTAAKVFLGRYLGQLAANIADANNPMVTSVNTVTRTWTDTNGNYVPDCDLRNFGVNGECGAISDQNFGRNNPSATRWDPSVIRGFGARDYFWDLAAELQHEIRSGISVNGGYYRSWFGNFRATDNLAVTAADYSPYCITAPVDSRLPDGGGYQVCGLYDIAPARFGVVSNLVVAASNFGKQTTVNDFFSFTVNSRFASGMRLGGGVDTGRTVADMCFVVDSPGATISAAGAFVGPFAATTINGQSICRTVSPYKANTQIKLHGSYPLPYDFVVSGILQNLPGTPIAANYAATNALVAPSLGRNLAACGTRVPCTATVTIPLVAPNTLFENRSTQLDLRLTKLLKFGSRIRVQANVDVYNALNSNAVLAVNNTYSAASWRMPTTIMDGRVVQFSGKLTF